MPHDPNDIDVTLPASADRVKTTVVQVVRDGEYDVARKDDQTLTTGYREEMLGPWDLVIALAIRHRTESRGSQRDTGDRTNNETTAFCTV
jgi:hypothetical protein